MKKLTAFILTTALMLSLSACSERGTNSEEEERTSRPKSTADKSDKNSDNTNFYTDVSIGDTIQFGEYDWKVLGIQDDRALIITDRIIERRLYHEENMDITWADCDLREYLNGELYNSFNENDKERIIKVTNQNLDNRWFGTNGGVDTQDFIFLLSVEEVAEYFGDSGQINADVIEFDGGLDDEYNSERIAKELGKHYTWFWVLRSPGRLASRSLIVDAAGRVNSVGREVRNSSSDVTGVRPALWLSLE